MSSPIYHSCSELVELFPLTFSIIIGIIAQMLKSFQKNKLLFFYPVALFLVNLVTKALFLTSEDIALDEPFSIYHAQFDVSTIISQLKNYNNPPLFEILLHFWIKLFGISPFSVRVFPLFFASLAPVVLYYSGKRFFSVPIGIAASLMLSTSSLLFYYAHDCRVYSLFLVLGSLSMHFFMTLTEEKNKQLNTFLFILFSSLLVYAHYFGVFILFFQGLYLLFFYRKRLLVFFGYYVIILLLYLPHMYPMITRMSHSVKQGTWLKPPNGAESLYNMLWAFSNEPVVTVLCSVILLAAFIKYIAGKNHSVNNKTALIVIWFLFSYFGMFFISYKVPMYISRYLIFVLPAYYILLAICTPYLFKNNAVKISATIVLVLSFVFSADLNPDKKQPIHEGLALIKKIKDKGTLVLVAPYDFLPAFAYHYNQQAFSEVNDQREYHLTDSLLKADHVYVSNGDQTNETIRDYKKIIYFGNGETYNNPASPLLKSLLNNYTQVYSRQYSSTYGIWVFIKTKNSNSI